MRASFARPRRFEDYAGWTLIAHCIPKPESGARSRGVNTACRRQGYTRIDVPRAAMLRLLHRRIRHVSNRLDFARGSVLWS